MMDFYRAKRGDYAAARLDRVAAQRLAHAMNAAAALGEHGDFGIVDLESLRSETRIEVLAQ